MKEPIRLFFIESVDPMDLLQDRTESQALAEICKIVGHETAVLTAYNKADFRKLCGYISSITSKHDKRKRRSIPLCVHLSTHGNEDGLAFGKDFMEWKEIMRSMKPIYTEMEDYDGEVILTISACGAGDQYLTEEFHNEWDKNVDFIPPKYVFVTTDEDVAWDDALVSWSMFYHQLPRADLDNKASVQKILDKIKISETGNLRYFRWDEASEQYLSYSGKKRRKPLTKKFSRR